MKMTKYKVCIISCGMIANSAHIPAYLYFNEYFDIAGVFDTNPIAAGNTAKKFNIPAFYTNAEEMLKKEKPDVVSVCVPNTFHKEYTMLALSYGANVLCEKPLAICKQDAVDMFSLAKKMNKTLMACQSMRFTPDRIAANEYIKENSLNDFYFCELSRTRRRGIPFWGAFHKKEISGGGALIDIGVHMLDALVWLMGNPKIKTVTAKAMQNHKYELGSLEKSGALTGNVDLLKNFDPEEMNVDDFASGLLTFENGTTVNLKVAWAANMPESSDISLIGKKCGIFLPTGSVLSEYDTEDNLKFSPLKFEGAFPGHKYLVENLLNVLQGKDVPFVTPEETINVSEILELFYKSAKSGKTECSNSTIQG